MNPRAFAIPLLALLCLLQLVALARAPAAWFPSSVAVALAPGETITLGRRELAAPLADASQLCLRRDAAGQWWIRNASASQQLILRRGGRDTRTGSIALQAGQEFRIGGASFTVTAAGGGRAAFEGAGHAWRYDGATLLRDGRPQDACPGASVPARAAAAWNRLAPEALKGARPLTIGGNLFCDNRLAASPAAPGSATVRRIDGVLRLETGTGDDEPSPVIVSSGSRSLELAPREETLSGVAGMVAGRTRFALAIDGARLLIAPQRQVALYAEPRALLPQPVEWRWERRSMWGLGGAAAAQAGAALFCLLALAAGWAWLRGAWPLARRASMPIRLACAANLALAAAGLCVLLALRGATPVGAGVSLLLGWAALWACMLAPGRLALATAAGLLLVAVGLLAQLELGLASMESSMLRHFQKTSALLALGLGAGTVVRLWLRGRPALLPQSRLEPLLALLAAGALVALLLQVAFGGETGVFDLQPVEFAKLALTALTAHCLAVGLGWHATLPEHEPRLLRWLRLGAPVLLFFALMGVALVQVDDFSPLILLSLWSAAMLLAWALAAGRHAVSAGLLGAGLAAAGAIVLLRGAGPGQLAEWGFYADRFMVWLEPARHPHTGQQLLAGARAIADGAWFGQDGMLGIASLGLPGSNALAIPAVQDDFAPSFFLNRHGLAAGLALWLLQALFLAGLLQAAVRSHAAGSATRDFRQAWSGRFRCFALCGGAAFVLGHLLLSWGTNLAIFPVMGQPMSFLSAGGSHLLFFICPLLILGAVSAQSLEENHDAGLCPT
ncbi:FtsW/RodA/SpoVE family cell cycle protein [Massilia cavernae]|uniref:Probable peptidoglycan glycosyltransferase FtsW n=1 Tax=Massilia cavernae TaxID=2320864 RepID=A0A418Y142_9BURK|nr:FtsW/RodA/SpoVE family cell cycle protein [Massilia cavernae]RJG19181.1 hypothetical protein D3872_08745 [Massilia cavernae]